MHVIYVDDEKPALENFRWTVAGFEEVKSLQLFNGDEKVIEWAKTHPVDVAFLDMEMAGLHGLELARMLKEVNRNIWVVFVTAYSEYALDAFRVDAIGYVLKPYSKADIKKELEKVAMMRPYVQKKVEIKTFPAFRVMVDGEVLKISNAKSKELLALFVERAGAGLTSGEAISYLWPERMNDTSTQSLYRMTLKRLMDALREAGVEEIIGSSGREKYIHTEKVDCDFYKVLEGDEEACKYYVGEFMQEYSWAEVRNAQLYSILKD